MIRLGLKAYLAKIDENQFIPYQYWLLMENFGKEVQEIICNIKEISTVPTMHPAGSRAKGTIIKDAFDLDLVFYYPNNTSESLEQIFYIIKETLQIKLRKEPHFKNVAVRIEFPEREDLDTRNFHIDIVPARILPDSEEYVWIYGWKERKTIKSSVSRHIQAVNTFKRPDILRLLKLWRVRNQCICPSFILERIAIEALNNLPYYWSLPNYKLIQQVFQYIRYSFPHRKFLADPADGSHNLIQEKEISDEEKDSLIQSAEYALNQELYTIQGWRQIYTRYG